MRTILNDLSTQLRGIWSRLDGGQRLVVASVLLATVAGLGAIVWFAGRPSYETVFTATSPDDLARARQALEQASISYLPDGKGGLQVERDKVAAASLAITQEGLTGAQSPSIGGGASLIEDSETKAWRLDAASRSMAEAAIRKLDGVVDVTVTASRPRRNVAFRESMAEQHASATVLLKLRTGVPFETMARPAASIAASQLMVPMKYIDVVSAIGGQRWRYDPDRETGGGTSEFLALQRNMSSERTRLAQERLDQLWPGKTAVQVSVELDPNWEVRSEKVVPTEALVQSEETKKDATEASVGQDAKAAPGNTSKTETKNKRYVTEIGERRVGKLMPEVRRMSVAVLYDQSLQINVDDLKKTVKAIVGWDPARDSEDAFSTMAGTFAAPIEEMVGGDGPGMSELVMRWGPTIGQVLGVFVVVIFLRGLFKSSRRPAAAAAAAGEAAAPEVREEDLTPDEQQRRMRREIERSIAGDPAALAKMLEAWLLEQKA